MIKVSAPFRLREIKKDSPVPFAIKCVPQDLVVRLESGVVHAGEWFSLVSTDGTYEQHGQFSSDEIRFEGLDPALRYTLTAGGQTLFADVPWAELAGLEGAPQPQHEAGKGDVRLRLEGEPGGRCVLRGEAGFEQSREAAEEVLFTGVPRDETLSLEIDGQLVFAGVPYTELAHLSGDSAEPELREHEMIDEHPNARSES